MVDNYDSFTYNVVRYFRELGADVEVLRNDECSVEQMLARRPRGLVISPGPCGPDSAGVSLELVRAACTQVPILGVCLGHQIIASALGARVARASRPVHGKTSIVEHDGRRLFEGVPSRFRAMRYHSLCVDGASLPDVLEVSAWCRDDDGELKIMALAHRDLPVFGLQFHPESVLSEHGHAILKNFLHFCEDEKR